MRNKLALASTPGHPDSKPAGATPTAERLFGALDGRWIAVAGDWWQTEVYGVLQDGGWRWIQVGLHGARDHMLTLRLAPTSGVDQLVLALTVWLAGAEPRPPTLNLG